MKPKRPRIVRQDKNDKLQGDKDQENKISDSVSRSADRHGPSEKGTDRKKGTSEEQKQYPENPGYHGTDDEKDLNPEE